jgi:hypothetical protein
MRLFKTVPKEPFWHDLEISDGFIDPDKAPVYPSFYFFPESEIVLNDFAGHWSASSDRPNGEYEMPPQPN